MIWYMCIGHPTVPIICNYSAQPVCLHLISLPLSLSLSMMASQHTCIYPIYLCFTCPHHISYLNQYLVPSRSWCHGQVTTSSEVSNALILQTTRPVLWRDVIHTCFNSDLNNAESPHISTPVGSYLELGANVLGNINHSRFRYITSLILSLSLTHSLFVCRYVLVWHTMYA